MSSKNPVQRFEDILENIVLIEHFTIGMSSESFREDPKACNAVERCLERISEAARKPGDTASEFCPDIPWPALRAVGNILRHEYDRVEISRIWTMVEDDLPSLKVCVRSALVQLRTNEK